MFLPRRQLLAMPSLALAANLALPARAQNAGGGGTIRIGIGASLRTLDVTKTTTGEEYMYDVMVYNGLTRIRPDLVVEPDLAESWSFSEDLKTFTFKLRRGVKFHHGKELVAEDVIATFRRILDPATGSAARSNYDMIREMMATDSHTVVFSLAYPYGGFADVLGDRQAKILPRDALESQATQPVGTGPFKFRSYTPGDRLLLARNPDYFEPGEPKLDGVELRIMPEMAVRIAALQAGDIDVVWDLTPENVRTLRDVRGVQVDSVATSTWDGAVLNNNIPPFNDVRVRQAFHLAAPKADIVELVLFGEGKPTHSPIPPNHPFFAGDIPFTPRPDVAGARRLLAQAGHARGIRLPIIIPVGRPLRERLGVTLQQMLRPAGFELEVQRVPYARYNTEVSGKVPLYIDGFFARPTVDTATYAFLHTRGSWNAQLWHYSDSRMDAALDAARLTGDVAQQKTHYQAMQHILAENPAGFFAYAMNYACGARAAVRDMPIHPMRWFELRRTSIAA